MRIPFNIAGWQGRARSRLPASIYHYLEGGADDELTLARNRSAFERLALMPASLQDVSRITLRRRLLGIEMALPLLLSPTGMSQLFHHDGERAVARAAEQAGVLYTLSTMGTTSIEDIAVASAGPKMFQLYIFRDRGLTRELIERCRAAGFDALCLTVDTPMAGNRERDLRWGMTLPPRITARSLLSFALHPRWLLQYLNNSKFELANVCHRVDTSAGGALGVIDYVNAQFDRTVGWSDAAWLAEQWGGKFVIKGLMRPSDIRQAASIGAHAVMLSNHGGRQLDGVPAPIECIEAARQEVGDRIDLIVDGGIRRGSDVLKALALGATACAIGRPYLYGLAGGGQAGVTGVLGLLRAELERGLTLAGCADIASLNASFVTR